MAAMRRTKASYTADAACAARAHGALHADARLRNPDHLAGRIVGMPFRIMLWPVLRRRFLQEYERRGPGVYFHHQARTKRFDALWVEELTAGTRQFVVLGAGFDTRAYRFTERPEGMQIFEVDHPLTGAEKQRRVRQVLRRKAPNVTYVSVDFAKDDLAERLEESGFDPEQRSFFLWEGVTPYHTAAEVDATLAFVAKMADGSSIAFDYVYRSALEAPSADAKKQFDLARAAGEPYDFGIDPADLGPLLARHALVLDSNLEPDEIIQRYLVGSDGRVWGKPPPFMGIAHARVIRPPTPPQWP